MNNNQFGNQDSGFAAPAAIAAPMPEWDEGAAAPMPGFDAAMPPGQVAYDHDGAIYPCDEARMLAAQGDTIFRIGGVGQSMEDTLAHPTVKALALASMLDSIPGCESCWNRPFCGVCPMHTYSNCGDIFGQRPRSSMCKRFYATASMLIERLAADADGSTEAIFRRWTVQRPREISGGT